MERVRSFTLHRTALILTRESFTKCCLPWLFLSSMSVELLTSVPLVSASWDPKAWSMCQRLGLGPASLFRMRLWLQEVVGSSNQLFFVFPPHSPSLPGNGSTERFAPAGSVFWSGVLATNPDPINILHHTNNLLMSFSPAPSSTFMSSVALAF